MRPSLVLSLSALLLFPFPTRAAEKASEAAKLKLPIFGVALTPPGGWKEIPRDKFKTIVQWISPDSTSQEHRALIMVEGGKPSDADARTTAEGLAKGWGGAVAPKQISLDGEPAWRVTAESNQAGLHPVEGIVAFHNGRVYMIMGGVTPGHSCHQQVEAVRASWKWIPVESCAKHLEFRPAPMTAFDAKVRINFPQLMSINATETPDRVLDLQMQDARGPTSSSFLLFAQLIGLQAGQKFEAVRDGFLPQMQQRIKASQELKWHDAKGPTSRVASQTVRLEDQNDEGRPLYEKFSLIKIDDGRVVLINFTFGTKDPGEVNAFDSAAEQVVSSVAPEPPQGGWRSAPK